MFKNITVRMKGGKTRKQRVMVLKSGKYKFVKNLRKSKSNPSRGKTKRKRSVKRTARRRYRRRRRRSKGMTIPLAVVGGVAAGVAEPIKLAMAGDVETAARVLCRNYTGYDYAEKMWHIERLKTGLLPLVAGLLVHKFVGGRPLNANAALARAGIPFIRI